MYKLEFILKQHTPIIHFQHNQDGATLRASEVKPKLDRFIIEKLTLTKKNQRGKNEVEVPTANFKHWFNNEEHLSLDYKLKIEPNVENKISIEPRHENSPMYFANMGNKPEEKAKYKHFKFTEGEISCTIITFNTTVVNNKTILKVLEENICKFFFQNNFGSRQSKGYGSFSVERYKINNEEWKFPLLDTSGHYKVDFENITEPDYKKKFILPFKYIDWFYRSLRSGINYKGLYFKSALFMYLYYKKKVQWDKKTIKAHYLNNIDQSLREFNKKKQKNISVNILYQETQSKNHHNPDILIKPILQDKKLELKLWRDLFGLSTEESWYSYRANINKKEAYIDTAGQWKPVNKKDIEIERFKSPITFKPILTDNKMTFFLLVNQSIIDELLNNKIKMLIEIKNWELKNKENGGFKYVNTLKKFDKSSLVLPFPDNFNFMEFLNFAINIEFDKHIIVPDNPNDEINIIISSLKNIYESLKEQLNSKNT